MKPLRDAFDGDIAISSLELCDYCLELKPLNGQKLAFYSRHFLCCCLTQVALVSFERHSVKVTSTAAEADAVVPHDTSAAI
jgi:hypothetical protein